MVYIYGLFNDYTKELVYVGRTRDPEGRLQAHKNSTAREFRDVCRMEILEECDSSGSTEEYFWIGYMRYVGATLLNKHVRLASRPMPTNKSLDVNVLQECMSRYKGRGMSIVELAAKSSLRFSTVYNISRGEPCMESSKRLIAKALGVKPAMLELKLV